MTAIALPAALAASLRMQAPQPLMADPDTLRVELPAAMQASKRWLLWRLESGRKVPYYASFTKRNGVLDNPKDRESLASLDQALTAIARRPGFNLGFALGPDGQGGCWQGIDLDHTEAHPGHAELAEMLPGYRERSPSGMGYHAIGYGQHFPALASNASGIEAYAAGRYFTVTGWALGGEVADLARFVAGTLAPLHGGRRTQASNDDGRTIIRVTDQQVTELRSALNAIDPDDREVWVAMGQALAELGNVGRGLWLDWSQMGSKWQPKDADNWATFRGDHTGYQAVFARAQQEGWANPARKGKTPQNGAHGPQDAGQEVGQAGQTQEAEQDDSTAFRPVSLEHLGNVVVDPPSFLIQTILPRGCVSLLGAHGESGKSFLGLVIAAHVACGKNWGGLNVNPGRALFLSMEDDAGILQHRLQNIATEYGLDYGALKRNLTVVDASDVPPLAQECTVDGGRTLKITPAGHRFIAMAKGYDLVLIDNASDAFAGNEIARDQVRAFIKQLGKVAKENRGALLLLVHVNREAVKNGAGGQSYSGSTGWHNSARSRLALVIQGESVSLVHEKSNYGPRLEQPIPIMRSATGVPYPAAQIDLTEANALKATGDDEAVLAAIRAAVAADRTVPTATTGPATAWHVLRTYPELSANLKKPQGKNLVDEAIIRLHRQKLIKPEAYRKDYKERERWLPVTIV